MGWGNLDTGKYCEMKAWKGDHVKELWILEGRLLVRRVGRKMMFSSTDVGLVVKKGKLIDEQDEDAT